MEESGVPVVEVIPPSQAVKVQQTVPITAAKKRRMPRWVLVTFLVFALLAGTGGVAYGRGWYRSYWHDYQEATLEVKVREDGKFAVEDARVDVAAQTQSTNRTGDASFTLLAGSYTYTVNAPGFEPYTATVEIGRGLVVSETISLTRLPTKLFSITGYIQDYVSDHPLVNVAVTLGSKTVQTNPAGEYSFKNVEEGEYPLTLTKEGYARKEIVVNVESGDVVMVQLQMVQNGRVPFVSNRDGKRGIYSANVDGSDVRRLVDSAGDSEDFAPTYSPDGKKIAFSSTRDGIKGTDGSVLSRLYVVNSDGTNLQKVSDSEDDVFAPVWSPNSQWLYSAASDLGTVNTSFHAVYDTSKKNLIKIGEVARATAFSADSSLFAYTVFSTNTVTTENATETVNVYRLKTIALASAERKTITDREQYLDNLSIASGTISYDVFSDGNRKRYSIPQAGGTESEIAVLPTQNRQYVTLGTTGEKAFIEARDGKTDLFVLEKDGKTERRLTSLGTLDADVLPRYDTATKTLVVGVRKEGERALYISSPAGGATKKITDYTPERP